MVIRLIGEIVAEHPNLIDDLFEPNGYQSKYYPDEDEVWNHHRAEPLFRRFFEESCRRNSIRSKDLSAAVWLLGRSLCQLYNPSEKNPSQYCERFCPLHENCKFYIPPGKKEQTHGILNLHRRPRSISGILPGMEDF